MEYLFAFLLLLVSAGSHELGHAFAMKKYGYRIHEICLLGIGPKLFSFKVPFIFGDTPISIRLFPLGAFVASIAPKSSLPLYAKHEVSLGGVVANARLFLVFWLLYLYQFLPTIAPERATPKFFAAILLVTLLFMVASFHKGMRFAFLLFATFGIFIMYSAFTKSSVSDFGMSSNITGIAKEMTGYREMLKICFSIQVALITVNSIPIPPLDGGAVIQDYLMDRFPKISTKIESFFQYGGIVIGLSLLGLMIAGDVSVVLKKLF